MRTLFVVLALALAGCGFHPMYAPTAAGEQAIGPVQIGEIEGKAGHVLRTELVRMLAVEGYAPDTPATRLQITLSESLYGAGYRIDESTSRSVLRLRANYVVTPPGRGRIIRGALTTEAQYDSPRAAFASVAAQDDARERAAETLARNMRDELALRLSQARRARR